MPKLTQSFVNAQAKPGSFGDGRGGHGLHLVVSPTGAKKFRQRLFFDGRPHNLGLGNARKVKLEDARKAAERNHALAKAGENPRMAALRQRRMAKAPTFAEAADKVIARHAPGHKDGAKTERAWRSGMATYCQPIASFPVSVIEPWQLLAILEPLFATKRRTGEQMRDRIRKVFAWARAHGYRRDNPMDDIMAAIPKGQAQGKHHAALHNGDVAKAVAKVRGANFVVEPVKLAYEFMVLTAVRLGNARNAKWSDIDLDAKVWSVPGEGMKMGEPHRVPLSSRAIAILEQARKLHDGDIVFVVAGKPVAENRFGKGRLREPLGIEATNHGFRSSFRDWSSEQGYSHDLLERALAHKVRNATEAAYNRTDLLEQRRPLMQAWADYLAQ